MKNKYKTNIVNDRDSLLTEFGKATLKDRYLAPGETYQELFRNRAINFSDNEEHAERIYEYMSKLWFMPATPILSNGGTDRGLPISCFLNETTDTLMGIADLWSENVWLASKGGGIGSYWGNVRSLHDAVSERGNSSGVIPFIKVQDALTLAISQGNLRRGSSAVYLPVWHPEIEEFIDIRRPTGGDPNRKSPNIHHGVVIDDAFMLAVKNNDIYDLISPLTSQVVEKVSARNLWRKIITARVETGEPYMLFSDTVNNNKPEALQILDIPIKTSNLCNEITLPTGADHLGNERTAVCCLSSLNLEKFEEWKDNPLFIEDVMRFLDNVLEEFIAKAPEEMHRAKYSAMRERSIGIGVMGFHSFLQSKGVPFEGVMAKTWNARIFNHISTNVDEANVKLGIEKGACPDNAECGIDRRFLHTMAVAPTASISVIAGNSSPGIEPYVANSFTQKTLSGSFTVRNKHLKKTLAMYNQDTEEVWSSIAMNEGSVQHLDFLPALDKAIFKTAFEIDPMWIIDLAGDRASLIDQSQSVNIFLAGDTSKDEAEKIHYQAWKKGLKGLYYCRSTSIQRAEKAIPKPNHISGELENMDDTECLSCQ